jgi:putative MATE family efflux protein
LKRLKTFYNAVWTIAVPITIQHIVVSSASIVDNLMVSVTGGEAVGAVGAINKFINLFWFFLYGFTSAAITFISQSLANNDWKNSRKMLGYNLFINIAIAVLFSYISFFHSSRIASIFTKDALSLKLASDYLYTLAPYFILSAIPYAFSYPIRAMGQAKITMVAVIISQSINIVFNYFLIGGNFMFPALGIKGAAIATNISKVFELCIMLILVYRFNYGVRLGIKDIKSFNSVYFSSYIKVGSFSAANQVLWALGITIYQALIGGISLPIMVAYGMVAPFEQLFINFFAGLGGAALILLGNALGKKDEEAAYSLAEQFNKVGIIFATFLGVIVFFFSKYILAIYTLFLEGSSNLNNIALENATSFLSILGLFMFVRINNMILSCGILRSGGDAIYIFVVETISLWCIGIPLVWITKQNGFQPYIIYLMMYVEEIIKLSIFRYRFKSKKWMNSLKYTKE